MAEQAMVKRSRFEVMLDDGTDMLRKVSADWDVDRMKKLAVIAVAQGVPELRAAAEKNPGSFLISVAQAASLRLSLDRNLQRAFLIPYGGAVTLQLGWRGIVELAYREPRIEAIETQGVYSGDTCKIMVGQRPVHEIPLVNRGQLVGAYAYIKMRASDEFLVEVETLEHANSIAARSRSPAWKSDFGEMVRKTPLKRLGKRLAFATDLSRGLAYDEEETAPEAAGPTTGDVLNAPLAPQEPEREPETPPPQLTAAQQEFAEEHQLFDIKEIEREMERKR